MKKFGAPIRLLVLPWSQLNTTSISTVASAFRCRAIANAMVRMSRSVSFWQCTQAREAVVNGLVLTSVGHRCSLFYSNPTGWPYLQSAYFLLLISIYKQIAQWLSWAKVIRWLCYLLFLPSPISILRLSGNCAIGMVTINLPFTKSAFISSFFARVGRLIER